MKNFFQCFQKLVGQMLVLHKDGLTFIGSEDFVQLV